MTDVFGNAIGDCKGGNWAYSNLSGDGGISGVAAGYEMYAAGGSDPYVEPHQDYGAFWKMVFPMGASDCDLQAAITAASAKLAEFNTMNNGQGKGLTWAVQNMDIGGYHHLPNTGVSGSPSGSHNTQGAAYQYIYNSTRALGTIISQYQNEYTRRVANGGGCINGMSKAEWDAQQQAALDLNIKQKSDELAALDLLKYTTPAAIKSQQMQADAVAAQSGASGRGAGAAANAVTLSSVLMIFGVITAVVMMGAGGIYLYHRAHKKA